MDKSEKIKRIKALQAEISKEVKEKHFDVALEKIDEILKLAPNLQKIKDLRGKIERRVSAQTTPGANAEVKEEKVESAEAAEIKEEEKSEVASPAVTVEEDAEKSPEESAAAPAPELQGDEPETEESDEKELTLEEIENMVKSTSEEEAVPEDEVQETVSVEEDIAPIEAEHDATAETSEAAEAEEPGAAAEEVIAHEEENEEEVPVESLDELLADVKDGDEEGTVSEEDFGILEGAAEDEMLTPEKVEKRLQELMEQEAEEEKSGARTEEPEEKQDEAVVPEMESPGDETEVLSDMEQVSEEEKPEPEAEEELNVESLLQDEETEDVHEEISAAETKEIEDSTAHATPEEESEKTIAAEESHETPEESESGDELNLEDLLSGSEEAEMEPDKTSAEKIDVFEDMEVDEPKPEKSTTVEVEKPELPQEDIDLEEIIASGKKDEPAVEREIPSMEPVSTPGETAKPSRDSYSLNMETEQETERPPQKTVIYGGKRKEKLDHSFKLSEEPGMGGGTGPAQPISQAASQDLDGAMEEIKKKGFKLRHIPQAIGFVFNMERLLFSTIGILFTLVVTLLLVSILGNKGLGAGISALLFTALNTVVASFICFTVIKQIEEQVHGRYSSLIPEFSSQVLPSAFLFWIFWVVLLGFFLAIAFGISYLLKINGIIFALASPVVFVLIAITASLLLASGLISFIVPAVVSVDKPGPMIVVKEVLFLLKNHFFTIFGGYLFEFILKLFIGFLSILVLIATYGMLFLMMMRINPQFMLKFLFSFKGILPLEHLTGQMGQMIMAMTPPAMVGAEKAAAFILMVVLAAGAIFILSIPFVFQNAAAVITFLTVKEKKQIIHHR